MYLDTVIWDKIVQLTTSSRETDLSWVGQKQTLKSKSIRGTLYFHEDDIKVVKDTSLTLTPNAEVVSDRSGRIIMMVYFPLDIAYWFSQDFNAQAYELEFDSDESQLSLRKRDVQPTGGSSGYTTIVIQDITGKSSVGRVFANRAPNKTIPEDPRGTI